MIPSFLHLPKNKRKQKAKEYNLLGQQKREENRLLKGPDYETVCWRFKQDRKGALIKHGVSFKNGKEIHWEIKHSTAGATNQFDIFVNNQLWNTGGRRKLRELGCPIKF